VTKRVLLIIASVILVCCGGAVAFGTWVFSRAATDTFGQVDFANRLAIPPLAQSHVDDRGRRVFDLVAGQGTHDFGSGHSATTWGFNGSYLGPTLRGSAGEQVIVNVRNNLNVESSVHWHGMHLPAAMDGGPHQPLRAGGTWSPTWKVDQPGATLWYHPHPHGDTADHVYRGLAGLFIVDDATTNALNLPKTYGVDDVPVIVQDKEFGGSDGLRRGNQFFGGDLGIMGSQIVVNGTYAPYLDVGTELVRLRILNASNARSYNFGFDDDRQFSLVGTDGGLLDKPARMDRVQLAMGERAEIVVRVKPGERLVLRSYDPDLGGGIERFSGGDDRFDVLQLRAAENLKGGTEIPAQLSKIDRLDPATAAVTRPFRLTGHAINGNKVNMNAVNFAATLGTTEIWNVFNNDGQAHSFHVHDVQFQVLSVGNRPPPPYLSGWKDTLPVHSDANYRIIMRFRDHSDPNRPYMYHCHVLFHEDQGMMGQFLVVKPGEKPGVINHAAH